MDCIQVTALILALLSFFMMIWLHFKTGRLQKSFAKSTRDNLEFIVNLIINASADPKMLLRLIKDYSKVNEWRGGLCRGENCKYHISFHIGGGDKIKIGDIEILVYNLK